VANHRTIRLGAGAGYAGDRIDPAVELAKHGNLDYLIFECLAERTIALAQQQRMQQPERGYDPLLTERMRRILPYIRNEHGQRRFRIITNMGAANPLGAARKISRVATELGLHGLRVAAVTGDDVLAQIRANDQDLLDIGVTPVDLGERLVSANAYLGAGGIVDALHHEADIVVTGRVADPALFLAPQIAAFGWSWDDWDALGRGTVAGHLLECAGQVTGGYFADPGLKDVHDLAHLGFPIAEISAHGDITITKVAGSGGQVTTQTCAEQLIYELHDPTAYLTPDVTADFSLVEFAQSDFDRVRVRGARGHAKPETLKVSVGYLDGYIGEGQISYGGSGALARARLARAIIVQRLPFVGVDADDIRADLIGVDALYGETLSQLQTEPPEVRLRIAGRCAKRADAVKIGNEVEALYTNGPAGGGGASKRVRQVVAVASLLWPADRVQASVQFEVAQ